MGVSKIVFGGETQIDLTEDTVAPEKMLKGTTAHGADGEPIVGTIEEVAQATPTIAVSTSGKITATATQSAGKVAAGTKTATKQLTVQAAKTWTPTTADQTIASGRYLIGTQTIKGDANLKAENIVSGVSIFGVAGTAETGGSGLQTCIVDINTINSYSGGTRDVYYANANGALEKLVVDMADGDFFATLTVPCGGIITVLGCPSYTTCSENIVLEKYDVSGAVTSGNKSATAVYRAPTTPGDSGWIELDFF